MKNELKVSKYIVTCFPVLGPLFTVFRAHRQIYSVQGQNKIFSFIVKFSFISRSSYINIVGLWQISIFCYLSVRQASHNQHENHTLLLHISGKFLSSLIAFGFRLIFTIFCKISCIYRFPELNNLVFTCRTITQNKQKTTKRATDYFVSLITPTSVALNNSFFLNYAGNANDVA